MNSASHRRKAKPSDPVSHCLAINKFKPKGSFFDFARERPFSRPPLNKQQLHAYWRMEYIEAPRYPASMKRPFTELPALGDDRAALIVHRSRFSYLLLNRFPYNPGHLLAIPWRSFPAPSGRT